MSDPKFFLLVPGNEVEPGGSIRSNFGGMMPRDRLLFDDLEAVEACLLRPSGELESGGVMGASSPKEEDMDDTLDKEAISGDDRIAGVIPLMQSTTRTLGVDLLP